MMGSLLFPKEGYIKSFFFVNNADLYHLLQHAIKRNTNMSSVNQFAHYEVVRGTEFLMYQHVCEFISD